MEFAKLPKYSVQQNRFVCLCDELFPFNFLIHLNMYFEKVSFLSLVYLHVLTSLTLSQTTNFILIQSETVLQTTISNLMKMAESSLKG